MNDSRDEASEDAQSAEPLQRLVERFRRAWRDGRRLQIEDCLLRLVESQRDEAFERLLELELRLRRAAWEAVSPSDYSARFPDRLPAIARRFAELQQDASPKSLSGSEPGGADASRASEVRPAVVSLGAGEPGGDDWLEDATEKNPAASQAAPANFGRYRILRRLGRGGMGSVYLAHDGQLDRKVALKIPTFRDDEDGEQVERFYREARAMATVQHANLCPIYDVGRFERWHYLTMAYVDGQSLSQLLKSSGRMPVAQAVPLVKTLAAAVQKAHDAGIVHRDLKPSNIMLTGDFEPMILDFGLARREKSGEAELTRSGAVFGSPAYMAPEQVEARHDEIGPATDLYALGVILYQMIAGRRPFDGSVGAIFSQIVSRDAAPPSKHNPEVPGELDAICLKALAKQPSDRHRSASQLADELHRFLQRWSGESHTASFPSGVSFAPLPEPWAASGLVQMNEPGSAPRTPDADDDSGRSDEVGSSRSRREAELRQVTIGVFSYDSDDSADASSSSLAERLHERMRSFAAFVRERVEHWGGVTAAGSGQEVIACFGFPRTYEDAPQRAVRAALDIQRGLAAPDRRSLLPSALEAWSVLHSGEAVAEELGEAGGETSVSVVGEARSTAARLSALAEPGSILISGATHQRVGLYFECESLGEQKVRGLSKPAPLFKVLKEAAARNRVDLADPGNLTPLVGRDTELSILKDRWEQALDGLGQIVLLIGDAGLGKSRLIRELREHVAREDVDDAAVIELRCSQYHQGTSLFPLAEYFTRLLDFEGRSPAERRESVVRYLHESGFDAVEDVALFSAMLSLPPDARHPIPELSPQKLKERTDALLLRWLKRLGEAGPVLFIVEDLHWLDGATTELLVKHHAEFESGRFLTVLTFRPEFESPWKSGPHLTQIALNRLTKRQIGEMMRKRTKRREIPDAILQQVIERTDGVPLFIEEFTVVIVESGVLDQPDPDDSSLRNVVPATLHDLFLSRLDRMEADREVVQIAATIGREFSFPLLTASCSLPPARLTEELGKLVKAEILFAKGRGADAAYIFKHALLQDAAYRSMLTKKRQAFHQRIGEVLETQFKDVIESQPALLAHHFTEGGESAKAIHYWIKAAQKSQEQSANPEAIRQFERALALTMETPASPQRDLLELSIKLPLSGVLMAVQGYAAAEVEPLQNRCIEICRAIGEGPPLFTVLIANWEWQFIRARFAHCDRLCPEIIDLAERLDGPGMKGEAYWTQNCTSLYAGDFESARRHALIGSQNHHREASIEYAKITQQNSGPLNLAYLGMALWQLGYPDQGFARLREGCELAYDLKHVFTRVMTEWKVGQTYDFARIGDKAVEYGDRCRRIADEQGFAFWIALSTGCLGVGLKHLGRFEEAIETLQAALDGLQATGSGILFPKYRCHLAESLWRVGRREPALQQWQQAWADQSTGEYSMQAELQRVRGDFHVDEGEWDAAETAYRQAVATADRQNARMYRLRAAVRLGELLRRRNRHAEAERLVRPLYDWFTEGFDMPDLQDARRFLAQA